MVVLTTNCRQKILMLTHFVSVNVEYFDPVNIAVKAKSPSSKYCYGYQNTDTQGYYINTIKLEIGCESTEHLEDHEKLLQIAAYDKAEANGTYIGQMNMIKVSSFSGPCAAVWGYDLVPSNDLRSKLLFNVHKDPHDMFQPHPQTPPLLPVFSIEPLLRASKSLFGTVSHPHFPIMAGAHVPCAVKEGYSFDPNTNKLSSGWLWSFISLAIAENRHKDASLFVEDAGFFSDNNFLHSENEIQDKLEGKLRNVAYCQYLCGRNQLTPYKEIFSGFRFKYIPPGSFGCALTCAPYILLAQGAYPKNEANQLVTMSLSTWEEAMLTSKEE